MKEDILTRLGEAQGKMILARLAGNKELEEHYKQVAIDTSKEFAKLKP